MWDPETNECLKKFIGHTSQVLCLEISFDKSKLYSGSYGETLRVWDIYSKECLKTIDLDSPIYCIKLISSNFLVVGLGFDEFDEWGNSYEENYIYEAKETLKIIDLNSGEIVKSFEKQSEAAVSLNFDLETNVLLVGFEKGKIRMWQF